MDTSLGPDVPHPGRPIPPTGQQHIYRGMEIHGVHSTQVTVIVPDGLKNKNYWNSFYSTIRCVNKIDYEA